MTPWKKCKPSFYLFVVRVTHVIDAFVIANFEFYRDDIDFEDEEIMEIKKESNFTILTKEDMMKEQTDQISKIAEIFEVREVSCSN